MEEKTAGAVWRCKDCGKERDPTPKEYKVFQMHAKGHNITLVNKETGELLADGLKDARKKGYFGPAGKESAVEMLQVTEMQMTAEGETHFPVRVWLPSSIFALFRYAKAAGYSKHESINQFLCEYAQRGFMEAHGVVLSLVTVEPISKDDKDSKKRLETLEKMMGAINTKLDGLAYHEVAKTKGEGG